MRRGEPLAAFAWAVARPARLVVARADRAASGRVALATRRAFARCPARPSPTSPPTCRPRVRRDFIEPLCVAALNTPIEEASGAVFLRVLRDALVGSPGSADLLLPRVGLGNVFPAPALAWLERNGATIRLAHRVDQIERDGAGWRVDGGNADHVVVAASAVEAARLVGPHAPAWAATAAALRYEPIATVYARSAGCTLPEPMLALHAGDADRPAQFVFDRGQLGGEAGTTRLRDQRRFALGRARHRRHRGGDAGAGETRSWAASSARRSRSCGPSSRSAPPSPARPAWSGRRWMSPRDSSPAATTSTAPTRRRSKARSAAVSRRRTPPPVDRARIPP